MAEIKCPCGLRNHMEEEDCKKTNCNACCPLTKPQTNADRLRAMSDEELAKWMAECNAYGERAEASQWLPWLKEPADGLTMGNKCVCCGADIPEGRQVCPKCEGGVEDGKDNKTAIR